MNTFIRLFRMPDTSGGGTASTVGEVAGLVQAGYGIAKDITSQHKINKLLKKRKAYSTPQEIYDILNATEYNAQTGYDPVTLNYLTDETNSAFNQSIGAVERLGGDPNMLSQIFGQNVDNIRRISADNHSQYMTNFSQYLNALNSVASNKAAEQKSQQDLIKDSLQAAGAELNAATGNISGGINTFLSSLSANEISNLYNADGTLKTPAQRGKRNTNAVSLAEEYNGLNTGFQP